MASPLTDTHPEAEAVQIALLRQATVTRRLAIMRSLSQTTIQLSKRAIHRASPAMTEREVALAFVAYHYGQDLADRLARDLERRDGRSV